MAPNASIHLKYLPLSLILLAVAVLSLGTSPKALAQNIQDVIVPCSACQNPTDLQTEATNYAETYNNRTPPGYVGVLANWGACTDVSSQNVTNGLATIITVVSTSIAISQSFYACYIYPYGQASRGYLRTPSISGNTFADTIGEDEILFARAQVANGRVTMPANLPFNGAGGSSTPDLWEAYISQVVLPEIGAPAPGLWHMITGAPTVLEGTFENTQTGQEFQAWNTDTIIATDQNGWTAEFQYTPGAPYNWILVANSIRDAQGNPVDTTNSYAPVPGGVAEPIGPINIMLPSTWGNVPVYVTPLYGAPIPQITVGPLTPNPAWLQCAALNTIGDCAFSTAGN